MQNVTRIDQEEEEQGIFQFEILNSLIIYNGGPLGENVDRMYAFGACPIAMHYGNDSVMAKHLRPYLPPFINEVNCVIVPVRYLKEFLA